MKMNSVWMKYKINSPTASIILSKLSTSPLTSWNLPVVSKTILDCEKFAEGVLWRNERKHWVKTKENLNPYLYICQTSDNLSRKSTCHVYTRHHAHGQLGQAFDYYSYHGCISLTVDQIVFPSLTIGSWCIRLDEWCHNTSAEHAGREAKFVVWWFKFSASGPIFAGMTVDIELRL